MEKCASNSSPTPRTFSGPEGGLDRLSLRLCFLASGGENLKSELEGAYGISVADLQVGTTEPACLKGAPYAAKKSVTYTLEGVRREQGWVYGFSEPYQIFILYMVLGKAGGKDLEDINKIIDSFRFIANSAAN